MDERRARLVTLGGLVAGPALLLLVAGAVLGFALNGLVVGVFVGAGVAGAWEVSRRLARGFEPLTMPAGGAVGAALVALVCGVFHFPHVAAAAAFGWGLGLAACVFLLIFKAKPWWRIALATLASLAVAWLSLGVSLALVPSFVGLLVALSFVLVVFGVEIVRDLVRAEGRLKPVLVAAASGVVIGILFGLVAHWWYGFGQAVAWRPFSSAWLGAVVGGVLAGILYAPPVSLAEVVRKRTGRRSAGGIALFAAIVLLAIVGGLIAEEGAVVSLLKKTRIDEMAAFALLGAVFLVPTYLMRRASLGTVTKLVVLAAIWLPAGVLWRGPAHVTRLALTTTVSARDRLAMVPWQGSLGGPEDPRARLVVARRGERFWEAPRTADIFATPANAARARSFRCVALPGERYDEIVRAARLRYPPPALFLTPEGEEIEALWGG